eukprot:GDKJ01001292.1.p2 GENE.GDKJ01001292.1~~GDKJ01001292.1.p2  ORF type:complete len:124 (-),score=3.53 GDKJ01001292.1:612-983(-)
MCIFVPPVLGSGPWYGITTPSGSVAGLEYPTSSKLRHGPSDLPVNGSWVRTTFSPSYSIGGVAVVGATEAVDLRVGFACSNSSSLRFSTNRAAISSLLGSGLVWARMLASSLTLTPIRAFLSA